jgi:6-phosphogluconolactonase
MDHFFDSREQASLAAAERILAAMQRRLETQGRASLVVSGGTTPGQCFETLASSAIDWKNVCVLLSDERWVPPDHDDSNEKLVRETLLVENAAGADLLSFFESNANIEKRCEQLHHEILSRPFPFACALLGMGLDGHFASLFPDAENLGTGLDVDASTACIPVRTKSSPYERVSLTLSALSRSDEIVLLFFGDDKRAVYEKAKDVGNGYPVSRLLVQKRAPVRVFWAP